jgi:hypothetical protein
MKTLLVNREAERPKIYEEELERRLANLKEQQDLCCLDYGLYDVLVALTNRGFFTNWSCAGHQMKKRGDIGICAHEIKGRNEAKMICNLLNFSTR